MIEAIIAIALGLGLAAALIVEEFRRAGIAPTSDPAKLIRAQSDPVDVPRRF